MFSTLFFQFLLYSCINLSTHERLKTKENFKLLSLKVVTVMVTYERWSRVIGSKYMYMYSDLTWKLLMFWKIGHGREEVTY